MWQADCSGGSDPVRLTSGAFAEFVATVEKISPGQRVWVLLDLMGRTARVAVQVV